MCQHEALHVQLQQPSGIMPITEPNPAHDQRQGHASEDLTVRAFRRVVPAQNEAVFLQGADNPFDQPDVSTIGMTGDDDLVLFRARSLIGFWIDPHPIPVQQRWAHAVAGNAKQSPAAHERQKPMAQQEHSLTSRIPGDLAVLCGPEKTVDLFYGFEQFGGVLLADIDFACRAEFGGLPEDIVEIGYGF
jgi:hypothetical protein